MSEQRTETEHAATKERVALMSVAASALIMLGKFVAGLMSGSLALMSEAAHALVDTAATIVTYFAVRTANAPPDADHHYGHGKFESLAALLETVILFMLAVAVVFHAVQRLQEGGGEFEPTILAFVVLGISIIIDINRVYTLRKVARETGSQALAADALHFASDLAGSIMVVLGLLAGVFGFKYGDALAAIGVAVFISIAGWRLGRKTVDTLLDAAPTGDAERLRPLIAAIPGVVAIDTLKLRSVGGENFGEVGIIVSRSLPLDNVIALKNRITDAVAAAMPHMRLTITSTPRALDTETVLERVLLIAAQRRLPVHHVTVQEIGENLSISFDVELNARMRLSVAHGLTTKFEDAIREEFGPATEVEAHIEPLAVAHLPGRETNADLVQRIASALRNHAAGTGTIFHIHNVRVRQSNAGLVVNYHCCANPDLDVASVHDSVDQLERQLRVHFPEVRRVVGHAEPIRNA